MNRSLCWAVTLRRPRARGGSSTAIPPMRKRRCDYNFAVARLCGTLRDAKLEPWKAPIRLGPRTLAWKRHPRPEWNPRLYELIPADQLDIRGSFVDEREIKAGLGAPLVAKRIADQVHEYAPTPHFYYAATVVARFEGSRCVLALEDPLETKPCASGRRTFPLAADFTAPLAMMLVEMHPKELELPRLLHPAKFAATTRIARLEPFDPNKTVVLVVHGLMDSPATWFPLINHLRADRRSGATTSSGFSVTRAVTRIRIPPPSFGANWMRRRNAIRCDKKMVVIGHSMGGCISRLLITDSERRLWDAMFTVPPERMDLTPEHKHILTESNIFAHRPEIGRVIFISAPHRGSNLAWTGWAASAPASCRCRPPCSPLAAKRRATKSMLPATCTSSASLTASIPWRRTTTSSFALNTVPINPGIPYHTIAGDRGRGDSPNSSDGVVPYWSSATCLTRSPKRSSPRITARTGIRTAIEEVHRILKEHRQNKIMHAAETHHRRKLPRWGWIVLGVVAAYLLVAYVVLPQLGKRNAQRHPDLLDGARLTHTGSGLPGDPLNIALVGSEEEVIRALIAAGWRPANPLSFRSSVRIVVDTVLAEPDPNAPVSNLYLFGRKEDLAFEKPVGHSPRERHHVRFWRSEQLDDGRPMWMGAATHDIGVELSRTTGQVTHRISPEVDTERDLLLADLTNAQRLLGTRWIAGFHKELQGRNGGGDPWHTDGRLSVATLSPARP